MEFVEPTALLAEVIEQCSVVPVRAAVALGFWFFRSPFEIKPVNLGNYTVACETTACLTIDLPHYPGG